MPRVNVNRSEANARNTNDEAELASVVQRIMGCFEEGIHAMRLEHTLTERWMSDLKREMQKATSEILVSFQQMESDMTHCQGLLNDVMKKYSFPAEHSQNIVLDGTFETTVQHASGSSMPAAATVKDKCPSKTLIESRSLQAAMLEKIEADAKRQEELSRLVESNCACYHDQCVPSMLVRFVHNPGFNNLCGLMTVVFAIAVGIEADLQMRAVLDGKSCPSWIERVVNFLNFWFVAEVTVRIIADGIHYFLDTDWRWNVFDLAIGVLSLVDMLADTGSFGFLRMLRALKTLKALRIVRLVRMFHDLRLLIAAMLTSLMSLIWSMVFLVMVIYLVAVTLVGAASTYVKENGGGRAVDDIHRFYTSLPQAMYTLLLCITSGVDWSDAASPVWHVGRVYGGAFILYVLFCLLGILNVVTSIFVERASTMRKHDRDFAVSEELRTMESDIGATMQLFQTLTEDGVHEIKMEHLEEILKDRRVIAHFASIGIEITNRAFIAHALGDTVGGGLVDTRAFVRGCFSLRGAAKQSDTFAIISHVKKVEALLGQMTPMLAQLASKSGQVEAVVPQRLQETSRAFTVPAQLAAKLGHAETDDNETEFERTVPEWHPTRARSDQPQAQLSDVHTVSQFSRRLQALNKSGASIDIDVNSLANIDVPPISDTQRILNGKN